MRQYYPGPNQGAKWGPQDVIGGPPVRGNYYFVDGSKSTGGSGTTWTDAFSTIQDAVDACTSRNNDVIFVAPPNNATNSNRYPENVTVYKYGVKIF